MHASRCSYCGDWCEHRDRQLEAVPPWGVTEEHPGYDWCGQEEHVPEEKEDRAGMVIRRICRRSAHNTPDEEAHKSAERHRDLQLQE